MTKTRRDNEINAFNVSSNVRGRILRAGQAIDMAIGKERYPEPVARLLAEATMTAALVAHSLKFDGKLSVQTHGSNEGAVSLMVAEATTAGTIRAYARFDEAALARVLAGAPNPSAGELIGSGTFAMTIDPDGDMERYQGVTAIESGSLAKCAEDYFNQSEQVPTRIELAAGQLTESGEPSWRGGGLVVQKVASDTARGDSDEAWDMARAVMDTLGADELLDPDLPADRLLFRLFHEQGVSMTPASPIAAKCSCSKQRLEQTLKTFDRAALREMAIDGVITADCEFCAAQYRFTGLAN